MSLRQEATVRRLTAFGLNRSESVQIVQYLNFLIENNGPEWTIDRLKKLKLNLLSKFTNIQPDWIWIAHRDGVPKGPLAPIFRLAHRKPQKALSCIMVYSSLVSPKLTEKQWKKFHDSVVKVRDKNSFLLYPDRFAFAKWFKPHLLETPDFESDHYLKMIKSSRRQPDYAKGCGATVNGTPINAMKSFSHQYARSYVNKHFTNLPDWVERDFHSRQSRIQDVVFSLENPQVGRISFLQEPGYKLRAIANPLPCFQILLEPLKNLLMKLLTRIPNDFTHDQDAGVVFIQQLLMDNIELSSIDLSDATNHLPMEDQQNILRAIVDPKDHYVIDLFEKVSRGEWLVSGVNTQSIKWNTGQPLGLGPSFASFALYHHFIVRTAYMLSGEVEAVNDLLRSLNGEGGFIKNTYNYAIVGDDIVLSSKVAPYYLELIAKLDCQVSVSKSIFNNDKFAEFCSRIISKKRVYRSYKWSVISDKSFMDFVRMHGSSVISLLRPKQRKVVETLIDCPSQFGGPLDLNPLGIPLWQREDKWWNMADILITEDKPDSYQPRSEFYYPILQSLGMLNRFDFRLSSLVNKPVIAKVEESETPHRRMWSMLVTHHGTKNTSFNSDEFLTLLRKTGIHYFSERMEPELARILGYVRDDHKQEAWTKDRQFNALCDLAEMVLRRQST